MERKATIAAALGGVLLLGAAGVAYLSGFRLEAAGKRAGAGGGDERRPEAGEARAAGTMHARGDPAGATLTSREEVGAPTALAGGEDLGRELGAALVPGLGRAGAVRAAVRAAREGKLAPVDLETKLRALALEGGPEVGAAILDELRAERRPEVALKLAQVIGTLLDDERLRAAAIDALRTTPDARPVGLLALMGRAEPEAQALAAECFLAGAPEARATAGFLLNTAPGASTAYAPPEVRAAARAALGDPAVPGRVREESCGILGRPGARDDEIALLERALLSAEEPQVRDRAFLALVGSGADRARIRPVLEQALADPAAPATLKDAIRVWLQLR